jgi:hypothetical protein
MNLYKWRRKILYQKPIPIDASFLQARGVAMTKVAIASLPLAMTSKLAVIMHIQDIDFSPLFRQNYYCGRIEGIYR